VVATAFCDLLMLSTEDFQTLMEEQPETLAAVRQVAEERMRDEQVIPAEAGTGKDDISKDVSRKRDSGTETPPV